MDIVIGSDRLGAIKICELKGKDHLKRFHLELQISDKYLNIDLEHLEDLIKALDTRKKEMIKLISK